MIDPDKVKIYSMRCYVRVLATSREEATAIVTEVQDYLMMKDLPIEGFREFDFDEQLEKEEDELSREERDEILEHQREVAERKAGWDPSP